MKIDKKIIIFTISVLAAAGLLYLSFRIAAEVMHPEEKISEKINSTFKKSFGKAVKFDTFGFNYKGDIVLYNFYLSNSADFNDNINLIKTEKMVIDTDFISLLKGKLKICGFIFYNPVLNIEKSYGKKYIGTFNEVFYSENKEKLTKDFTEGKIRIQFINSRFSYKEVFKNSRTSVDFYDLDIDAEYFNGRICCTIEGAVKNKTQKRNRKGRIFLKGNMDSNMKSFESRIEIEHFDLSCLNDFLKEKKIIPLNLSGTLGGTFQLMKKENNFDFTGNFHTAGFGAAYPSEGNHNQIISNENLKSDLKFSIDDKAGVKVEKFSIEDGVLKFSSQASYKKDENLSISFKTNSINLEQLSDTVTPFMKSSYNGYLSTAGDISVNLKKMSPEKIDFNFDLKDFNLTPKLKDSTRPAVTDCSTIIKITREHFSLEAGLNIGKSVFNVDFSGTISDWNPFKSNSIASVSSENIELGQVKKVLIPGLERIYERGFQDMYKGYDQMYFLKEPEGIFFNNNDAKISIIAKKLTVAGNAAFSNLALGLSLKNGLLRTENFSLEGYDGKYSMDIHANLNQNYPFIKAEGEVSDLNLGELSGETGRDCSIAGLLTADFSYNANAYRVGHFVQNGKGELNLKIRDGEFSNCRPQKMITEYLKKNGYQDADLQTAGFTSFTAGFKQAGHNFYVKNFGLHGEKLNFQTYGRYRNKSGLNVPVQLNISGEKKKTTRVPLLLYGELKAPCLKIRSKKIDESVCF